MIKPAKLFRTLSFGPVTIKKERQLFHCISVSLAGNSGRLTREGTAAARPAIPIPISVCCIFVSPNNATAVRVWDF